jgi:hypothetical protein
MRADSDDSSFETWSEATGAGFLNRRGLSLRSIGHAVSKGKPSRQRKCNFLLRLHSGLLISRESEPKRFHIPID